MPIIATEALAKSIGGSSASVTANLMVTRVRAVALGCSIRNSYANNLLVCLRDLYKVYCTGQCDNHQYVCNVVGCIEDGKGSTYECTCNNTCGCLTTCSCTSVCSCNTHCTCKTNWIVNCNGRLSGNGGVSSSGNTSTCTSECTSVSGVTWCTVWCPSESYCSSKACPNWSGCGSCHGGYEGYGWGCYEVWKCQGHCDGYLQKCNCNGSNNKYTCTCDTECDGNCNNCTCNNSNCTCNATCSCTGGHWSSSKCSCDTTCSCNTACNNCPSNG